MALNCPGMINCTGTKAVKHFHLRIDYDAFDMFVCVCVVLSVAVCTTLISQFFPHT